MAQRMSITRALVQLKRLESQINKATEATFTFLSIKEANKNSIHGNPSLTKESSAKEGKSNLDSVLGLIEQRRAIKAAIVQSNATTKVKINNVEMTVAEAIEMKHTISFKDRLRSRLESQRSTIIRSEEKIRNLFEEKLEKRLRIEAEGGSDATVLETISKSFNENNTVEFVNLKMVEDEIKKLDAEIEAVESDLDQILTESNSTTFIEI